MKGIYEVKIKHLNMDYKHTLYAKSFDHAARRVSQLDLCPQEAIRSVKFISS